jgi:hypothetical protein
MGLLIVGYSRAETLQCFGMSVDVLLYLRHDETLLQELICHFSLKVVESSQEPVMGFRARQLLLVWRKIR